jgi:hypothetical protein
MTRAGRRLYLKVVRVYRAIAVKLLREVGEDELALCYAVIGKIERATAAPADDRDAPSGVLNRGATSDVE